MTPAAYPLSAVRAVALHAQSLDQPDSPEKNTAKEDIAALANKLGCIQIDTLQMVSRSQQLVLWSRLGSYNRQDFDDLIYRAEDRRLFEGWMHAASFVPIREYRYQMPRQRQSKERHTSVEGSGWLTDPENRELLNRVLNRIRQEGGLRVSDFEGDGKPRGGWWDWKPAKYALEHLFAWGELMIEKRINFQRVYNLTERVLPDWVDRGEPTEEERDRFWLERGVRAFGICKPDQACDFAYLKKGTSRKIVNELVKKGVLLEIQGTLYDGSVETFVICRDHLPLLEMAADGELNAQRTTFLSPFDSLYWPKRRDMELWGFYQTLECYVPAPKRIWGYFSLPVLYHDRLVGRFDPKLERSNGLLRIKSFHLESGIEPEEEMVREIAAAMRDFLKFHSAGNLEIEQSNPIELGRLLVKAL
jgi:uncharacterized protein YcaQ